MTNHFEHHDNAAFDGALATRTVDPRTTRLIALGIAVVVLLLAFLVAAQTGVGGSSRGTAPRLVRSAATGVEVRVPGESTQRIAQAQPIVGKRPTASRSVPSYAYPADGSLISASKISASARLGAASAAANSQVDVASITLFNGRVKLSGLSMRAQSAVTDHRATGTVGLGPDAVLLVDGKTQKLDANRQIVIPNVGTVSINEQAVVSTAPSGDELTGPRHHVVGAAVHVRLSAAYAGAPAGTELIIGRVDSGVRDRKIVPLKSPKTGVVSPVPTPAAATVPVAPVAPAVVSTGNSTFSPQTGNPKPGDAVLPRKDSTVKGQAAGGQTGNLQGYVFPVLSDAANFTNDWGGFRADVPAGHQGNDIFATEGTPIVAMADGVLDRAGWNAVGGYRFWLFDQYGNGFYGCHLS
ncbi:MAG: hypothetical protein H7123_07095, partial [Thermoleophilia bacterium]|nr:hypothetical protein [Thermoleophilia bacterium]